MTAAVTETGPFERLVTLHITDADIDAAKGQAARRLSRDLKIPGFRPGKAPRPVVEAAVGTGRLRTEAIEDLIPKRLSELLEEADLQPAITPSLESVDDVDGGVAAEVKVTLWPALHEAPRYRDRPVEVESYELTPEEVENSLTRMRDQFAVLETVERAAGEGDFVSIDIKAVAGGEDIPEAAAAELLYEVGSGMLIEGVDGHLEGRAAGEEVTFLAPLPAGFGDRAGLEATFTVKVNEVKAKVLPILDDEWVDEVTEFETVSELREELERQLRAAKRRAVAQDYRQKLLDLLIEEAEVELPEALLRAEMDDLVHRFAHRLEEQDVSLDDYFAATGITPDEFLEDVRQQADRALRTRLVLEAVAKAEEIKVTSEEVAGTIELIARASSDPEKARRALMEQPRALSIAGDILRNKALAAAAAGARPVDAEGNPVELVMTESTEVLEQIPGVLDTPEVEAELVEGWTEQPVVEAEVVEAEIVDEEA
jgi:trigger factor